jgi:hypothetical protein
MNSLEQWLSVLFRGLQPIELQENLAPECLQRVSQRDLPHDIGLSEPLAQSFNFTDDSMKNESFRWSKKPLKLEYYNWKKAYNPPNRVEPLLRGDLYNGSFTKDYKAKDLIFFVGNQFRIGRIFVDRLAPASFPVHCDLRPDGPIHEIPIIRGMRSPKKYNDTAARLGIRLSGLRACDNIESWMWLSLSSDRDL